MRGMIAVRGERTLCQVRPRQRAMGERTIRLTGRAGLPALHVAIAQAKRALADALDAYRRDPEDEETWSPVGEARHALALCRERLERAEEKTRRLWPRCEICGRRDEEVSHYEHALLPAGPPRYMHLGLCPDPSVYVGTPEVDWDSIDLGEGDDDDPAAADDGHDDDAHNGRKAPPSYLQELGAWLRHVVAPGGAG